MRLSGSCRHCDRSAVSSVRGPGPGGAQRAPDVRARVRTYAKGALCSSDGLAEHGARFRVFAVILRGVCTFRLDGHSACVATACVADTRAPEVPPCFKQRGARSGGAGAPAPAPARRARLGWAGGARPAGLALTGRQAGRQAGWLAGRGRGPLLRRCALRVRSCSSPWCVGWAPVCRLPRAWADRGGGAVACCAGRRPPGRIVQL